ncbi:MAG TPA: hypothetical protein VGG09_02485, partial [Acidimicrobiales bacterium]
MGRLRSQAAALVAAVVLFGVVTPLMTATPASAAVRASSAARAWGATAQQPCDPLDGSQCMLPFPDDYYTVPDPATTTGLRVSLPAAAFPAAVGGTPFNPLPWNGNDGFSPGSTILTHVPGLDLRSSHVATLSDIGDSLKTTSPVILLDTTTGQRWPTWSELDVTDHDAATQLLIVHPARNLTEGDHYVVALRNLKTSTGAAIAPAAAFADALGRGPTVRAVSSADVAHLRGDLTTLARAAVSRSGMFLAWDFTVASTKNITGPALTMRDQTFSTLGHSVGPYLVTQVVNDPPGQPDLAREVLGYFDVPSYLTGAGGALGTVLSTGTD